MPNDWLSEIAAKVTLKDLPENYREVARIAGVEIALKLSRHLGGSAYYYPQIDSLLRDKRDEQIRAEFNGFNHRDLARKYELTESWIREIVQRKPADKTADMFEDGDGHA